jgi:hypothetical protein
MRKNCVRSSRPPFWLVRGNLSHQQSERGAMPQCIHFVQKWLPAVLVKWLDLAERALEPTHIERAMLNVSIGEL